MWEHSSYFLINIFKFQCIYWGDGTSMLAMKHMWKSDDKFQKLAFFSPHMGPRNQTHVIKCSGMFLNFLSYFANPKVHFYMLTFSSSNKIIYKYPLSYWTHFTHKHIHSEMCWHTQNISILPNEIVNTRLFHGTWFQVLYIIKKHYL